MRTKAAAVSWAHKMHSSRLDGGGSGSGRDSEAGRYIDADEGQVPGESAGSE